MRSKDGVDWEVSDRVGRIVLNRPEHANAIDVPTAHALARAIEEVVAEVPRVIVVGGRGRFFCAGGDIKAFVAAGDRLAELIADILAPLIPAFTRLCQNPAPVVTAVHGPVGGGGVGIALCGDFVVASTAMKLRTGYAAIGLSSDLCSSYFLARRAGVTRAQRLLMTNELVSAQRCLEWGIVDELHPETAFDAAVDALVQQLRDAAPASLAATKRLFADFGTPPLELHLALERQLLDACARTADAREGVSAFAAKRAARFAGH